MYKDHTSCCPGKIQKCITYTLYLHDRSTLLPWRKYETKEKRPQRFCQNAEYIIALPKITPEVDFVTSPICQIETKLLTMYHIRGNPARRANVKKVVRNRQE